jgi:hypothetical protein
LTFLGLEMVFDPLDLLGQVLEVVGLHQHHDGPMHGSGLSAR